MHTRLTYIPVAGLAALALVSVVASLVTPERHSERSAPPAPVISIAVAPTVAPPSPREPPSPYDPNTDLDRTAVDAALAELTGPTPSLGPALAPLTTGRIRPFDVALFDTVYRLGERLHVSILDRVDRVMIIFPGGTATWDRIDAALTVKWGKASMDGDCSLWIDRVRQWQLSRCIGNEMASTDLTLTWAPYSTPAQWIGTRGALFGIEPRRLIGAEPAVIKTFVGGSPKGESGGFDDHSASWSVPQVGPGIKPSSSVGVHWRDRVDRWETTAWTDPAPVLDALRAKYGVPADESGNCCVPDATGPVWGYVHWVAAGQRIEATLSSDSVTIVIEDAALARAGW